MCWLYFYDAVLFRLYPQVYLTDCSSCHADAKVFESDDTFLQRVEGIMTLYGAIVQVQSN